MLKERLDTSRVDEVVDTCWSMMWNATDETPYNSECFLNARGMDLFVRCLQKWPSRGELIRNMMGLLGNVAEVTNLRAMLCTREYIGIFDQLLENLLDGIEIPYNSAGVLANILADGPHMWPPRDDEGWTQVPGGDVWLSREAVSEHLVKVISKWDRTSKRNINYRSFGPILRLVQCFAAPAAQYWAIWALDNLTTVTPERYCPMLLTEGGLPLLEMCTKPSNADRTSTVYLGVGPLGEGQLGPLQETIHSAQQCVQRLYKWLIEHPVESSGTQLANGD